MPSWRAAGASTRRRPSAWGSTFTRLATSATPLRPTASSVAGKLQYLRTNRWYYRSENIAMICWTDHWSRKCLLTTQNINCGTLLAVSHHITGTRLSSPCWRRRASSNCTAGERMLSMLSYISVIHSLMCQHPYYSNRDAYFSKYKANMKNRGK